ncbi:hypothetical protein [Paraglaciecola sp. L3A3]|uniref:hypothetical protein n=1 Tax=Paraglaciecola sp. L3A3 TaxID=2686358 RepID=UPI00131E00A8|nr:hypothetical protein [Paraglaciecola sp. L3A3]
MTNSNYKKWLILLATIPMITYLILSPQLPNGYIYIDYSSYFNSIEREGEVIVAPVVIDIDSTSDFIVGIKLPLDYRNCYKNKEDLDIPTPLTALGVLNLSEFFIVNTESHKVLRFKDKQKFESAMLDLGILAKIELDYSQLNKFWENIPQTSKWDSTLSPECPLIKQGESGYKFSIAADLDSGFRTIEEIPYLKE